MGVVVPADVLQWEGDLIKFVFFWLWVIDLQTACVIYVAETGLNLTHDFTGAHGA